MDIATSIFCVLDALPTRVADAETDVHAFSASIEPEIVCTPFLNASRKMTDGTLVVATRRDNFTSMSRVRGTDMAKVTRIIIAMIAAEAQRRI